MEQSKCNKCDNSYETIDGDKLCLITLAKLPADNQIPSWCPKKQNCHLYCEYARYCHEKGVDGKNPDNCANYFHIEDIINDAKQYEAEERAEREREDYEDDEDEDEESDDEW